MNVTQTSTIDLLANGGPYSFGPLSVSNGSALHFTSGPANVAFVGGTTISGGPTFDVQNGNVWTWARWSATTTALRLAARAR